jgi:hypothetical protein
MLNPAARNQPAGGIIANNDSARELDSDFQIPAS